jgi:multicomponent Na+:H+ antiporter subunit G
VSLQLVIDAASWACLVAGGLFSVVGTLGLIRLPDFFTRMHGASVTDTLGAGLILLGLVLQAGLTLVAVKLGFLAIFIFFASPAATHALVKAALARGVKPLLAPEEEPSKP